MLQCVAVCCSVLQCVAACCSVYKSNHLPQPLPLHFPLTHTYMLRCVAVCCTLLHCAAVRLYLNISHNLYPSISHSHAHTCCSVLQRVAACCSVLQYVAVCLHPIHSHNLYPSIFYSPLHHTRHHIPHITSCEIQFGRERFNPSQYDIFLECQRVKRHCKYHIMRNVTSKVTETRRHHISHTSHFDTCNFLEYDFARDIMRNVIV